MVPTEQPPTKKTDRETTRDATQCVREEKKHAFSLPTHETARHRDRNYYAFNSRPEREDDKEQVLSIMPYSKSGWTANKTDRRLFHVAKKQRVLQSSRYHSAVKRRNKVWPSNQITPTPLSPNDNHPIADTACMAFLEKYRTSRSESSTKLSSAGRICASTAAFCGQAGGGGGGGTRQRRRVQ